MLAIDADPNSCFADALGVKGSGTIVGICEEISKNMDKIPSGMVKDRYIEMEVQESTVESDLFDLIVMGRPEGPGCYCYVNNLLRGLIGNITKNYEYVIIDNAAGMEHISRRTMGDVDSLVIISDYSASGLRAAKKIFELAVDLKIKMAHAGLVINKVRTPDKSMEKNIKLSGIDIVGELPYSEDIERWNIEGGSVFSFTSPDILEKVWAICRKITE